MSSSSASSASSSSSSSLAPPSLPQAPLPSAAAAAAASGGGGGTTSLASSSASALTDDAVAAYLLQKRYLLAALELHQELLEGNNGVHGVAALHRFFGDESKLLSLTQRTELEEANAKKAAAGACEQLREQLRDRRRRRTGEAGAVLRQPEAARGGISSFLTTTAPSLPNAAAGFGVVAAAPSSASLAPAAAPSVDSPFASGGLQSSLAARDQRIALLEYRLRCADEDARSLRAQLDDALRQEAPFE